MKVLRFPIALVLALALMGGLFSFIAVMIRATVEVGEKKQAAKIEFTRLRRDSDVKVIKREKPQPDVQAKTTTASVPQVSSPGVQLGNFAGPIAVGAGAGVTVDVRGVLGSTPTTVSLGGSDRAEIPLVRIEPDYPPRAMARGIEGWTLVHFTITAAGTVRDAVVVDADPPDVFNAAAIKAVERWKYNPKVEDGVALEHRGVQVRLTFKLER